MSANPIRRIILGAGATNQIQLVKTLGGNVNVAVDGEPWSWSQQGDFTSAEWNVVGESISTVGPNATFPIGQLKKRLWNIHRKLVMAAFNGQSNDVGANTNQAGVADPTTPFMQLPPFPDKLKAYTGGFTPTQDGVGGPAVGTFILPAQYAGIVPGHENINTGRVGDPVNRQMWSSAFGQVIAAALPNDNVMLLWNVGHGGTPFSLDVRGAAFLANAFWSAGIAVFMFTQFIGLPVGASFIVQNAGGFTGTYRALTSDGMNVTATKVSDPGVFVPGSYALVPMPPMVNCYNMLQYAVDTIAPALNLDPYFAVFGYNGNEADDTLGTTANFFTQFQALSSMTDDFRTITGQSEPVRKCWAQVSYPAASWQIADPSLWNCASNVTLGILEVAEDLGNNAITNPQYSSVSAAAPPCIHYGVQGGSDNGERAAGKFLDVVIDGADPRPPRMVEGEEILYRVANSKFIHGPFSEVVIIDTESNITNPGNHGIQAYSGIMGIDGADGGNGHEEALTGIVVDGATIEAELADLPTVPWGNYITAGYNNALIDNLPSDTDIETASWSPDGTITFITEEAVPYTEGDIISLFQNDPATYDFVPGVACLAGTGGTTIIMPKATDPGPLVTPGHLAINGNYGIGPEAGLRTQIRAPAIKHYSTCTGAPLPDWLAIQKAAIDVYASTGGIWQAIQELGMESMFDLVLDYANGTCYSGTGDTVSNLVPDRPELDYWLGLGDGSDARDPTFVGTPNTLTRATYFGATADGKIFTPQTTVDNPLLATAHNAGGECTIINGIMRHSSLTQPLYDVATCTAEGVSGQGPGIAKRMAPNGKWVILVEGDGGSPVYTRNMIGIVPLDTFAITGLGIKAGDNQSWGFTSSAGLTTAAGFERFTPVFNSPSTQPAQSAPYFWQNSATGGSRFSTGAKTMFTVIANQKIPQPIILPLMRTMARRQLHGLPA